MQPIGRIQREEKQLQGTTVFSSALSAQFKDTPHPLSILACIKHPGKTPWSTLQVLPFFPRTAGPLTDLSDLTRAELTTFFHELGIVLGAMMTETSIAVTSVRISLGKARNRYSPDDDHSTPATHILSNVYSLSLSKFLLSGNQTWTLS